MSGRGLSLFLDPTPEVKLWRPDLEADWPGEELFLDMRGAGELLLTVGLVLK